MVRRMYNLNESRKVDESKEMNNGLGSTREQCVCVHFETSFIDKQHELKKDSDTTLNKKEIIRRPKKPIVVQAGDISDKQRWRSIRVMYLTMFLSSVTFTLTMSSLWPFLLVLDSTATSDFLGWVVASYSLGQLVASPVFGLWANIRGQSREPLVVSVFLGVGANLMYAYLESIPGKRAVYMIVARGVIGFTSGNVAVVRSYVSGATSLKERTPAMANVSIFQSLGFILGPAIQAAFTPLSYPGPIHTKGFHLNEYTAPGFLGAIVCAVNVVLLFAVFREFRMPDEIGITTIGSSYEESLKKYKPDYFGVISAIVIFFVVLFVFTVFETITTPLSMYMFGWSKSQATLYIGIILAVCGVESIGVFIGLKALSKRFNERYLLVAGFILCFIGSFIQIPWGSDHPPIAYTAETKDQQRNATLFEIKGLYHKQVKDNTLQMLRNMEIVNDPHLLLPTLETSNATTSSLTESGLSSAATVSTSALTESGLSSAATVSTTSALTESALSSAATVSQSSELTAETMKSAFTEILSSSTPAATSEAVISTIDTASTIKSTATLLSTLTTEYNNGTGGNTTIAPRGCPATLKWCLSDPPIYLAQFIAGCVIISMGYPATNVMTYTLYSKILGPKPQGMWMGWLTASGSLARTLGPIFVSQIYNSFGPRITFAADCGVIVLTIIAIILVFKRLVPCKHTLDIESVNGKLN